MTPPRRPGSDATPEKPHTQRPDEMSPETLEFLAEIDEHRRVKMLSQLPVEGTLDVLRDLGYRRGAKRGGKQELQELLAAIDAYKQRHGRLFPTWSEVFHVARELGYERDADADVA